jgi:hypothetical protein
VGGFVMTTSSHDLVWPVLQGWTKHVSTRRKMKPFCFNCCSRVHENDVTAAINSSYIQQSIHMQYMLLFEMCDSNV